MKRFLFYGLFSIMNICIFGQDSLLTRKDLTYFEFAIGASHLSNEYIMDQKKQWGVSGSARLRFETKNQKFAISPFFNFRVYQVGVQNESFDNVMTIFKGGLILDYALYCNYKKNLFIYNDLELGYGRCRNFLREAAGSETTYDPNGPQETTKYNTQTLYSGNVLSIVLGYKIKYKVFFMEIGYDIMKSYITYDNDLLSSLISKDPNTEKHPGIILNSLNINIGLSVPFKYFTRF